MPPKRTRRRKKTAPAESVPPVEAPKPQEWPACEVCHRTDAFTHQMYEYVGERVVKRQVCEACGEKRRTLFYRLGQGAAPNRTERRAHLHQHANQRGVYRAKATAGAATPLVMLPRCCSQPCPAPPACAAGRA